MAGDIVPGVPWRWVATPNHGDARASTLGVVVHSTRGGAGSLATEYMQTVRFCAQGPPVNSAQVGPHWVVGPAQVTRMVHDQDTCYCQTVDNPTHIGIEVCQPFPTTAYTEFQYHAVADLCARYCVKYRIPVSYIGKQYTATVTKPGILGHEDTRAGWSRGKSDPGDRWNWSHFCQLLEAKHRALTSPPDIWRGIGAGLVAYCKAHGLTPRPEPALRWFDVYHDEYLWVKGNAAHPHGGMLTYRASTGEIGEMWWSRSP